MRFRHTRGYIRERQTFRSPGITPPTRHLPFRRFLPRWDGKWR